MRVKAVFAALCVAALFPLALAGCDDSDDSSATSSTTSAARKPIATARPLTRAQRKAQFLETVNEAISGPAIEGNPYRYVGKNVDLHCTVEDIPDAQFFNAACGEEDDGTDAIIVVLADTRTLAKGQSVRVIGTVANPIEGNNAMGGTMHFPTVQAHFME